MKRIAAIMAGGHGERFWPLSRKSRPKQLLPLSGSGRTMLQDAVDRITPLIPVEQTYIATSRPLLDAVVAATPEVAPERTLAEPAKRNTGGCLAWLAAQLLATESEDVVIAVLTSDHDIRSPEAFRGTIDRALTQAEEGGLVTIGIRPTRPETGFGYIQMGAGDGPVRRVEKFHEKPSAERALQYLDHGGFLWNSGMFFWKLSTFMSELAKVDPMYAETVQGIASALKAGDAGTAERMFETLPNTSIDYLLMEKADQVYVIEADFPWDDLGTLASLEGVLPLDQNGNGSRGDSVFVDSENCLVINEVRGMKVCALGMEDVVIVATPDAVLVLPKDRAQDVRKIVAAVERTSGQP